MKRCQADFTRWTSESAEISRRTLTDLAKRFVRATTATGRLLKGVAVQALGGMNYWAQFPEEEIGPRGGVRLGHLGE